MHNTQAKARFEVVEPEDVSLEDHDVIAEERGFEADRNLRPVEAHAAWRTLRGLKMIWNQKGKNDSGLKKKKVSVSEKVESLTNSSFFERKKTRNIKSSWRPFRPCFSLP